MQLRRWQKWRNNRYIAYVQTLFDLRSGYVPEAQAQVEFCASWNSLDIWSAVWVYVYIEGSPLKTERRTYWNLIGRSLTVPPPLLSPSSILPPSACIYAFHFRQEKSARVSKILLFQPLLLFFLNLLKADSVISDCIPRGVSAHSFCLRLITLFLLARGCS